MLVAYGTKMGGTAEIATKVAEALRAHGHQVTLAAAGEVRHGESYEAAVVGSGIYAGRWRREAVGLLKRLARASDKPSRLWLFHSGPLGDEHGDDPVALPRKVRALADRLGAEDVVTFGGRLPADARGFIARAMARNGMGGDWRRLEQAEAWGGAMAAELEGRQE
ncbi:MAG: flavodoxin [Acidimicrobiia bacterium]|nr:flavodoxin [Acidimicrobiia bacterium]